MFSIEVENLVALQSDFALTEARLAYGLEKAVERACIEGANEARTAHRYQDRTGDLTRSISSRMLRQTRGGAEGEILAAAAYASYVEEGTRPHEIWPKVAAGTYGPLQAGQSRLSRAETKAIKQRNRVAGRGYTLGTRLLAWQEVAGDWHFARMVHHPGTKPYGFMGQAYDKAERALIREIEIEIYAASHRLLN